MKSLRYVAIFFLLFPVVLLLKAADNKAPQVMDSGSFGIFVNGNRVGTETFSIEQRDDIGVTSSELKFTVGELRADQSSEMQLTAKGDLKMYSWHSSIPAKEEATVVPKDDLLVEHLLPADQKKIDVPHLLPASTIILDDYFFSHRQMLVLRYISAKCKFTSGAVQCDPAEYLVLVPHQHVSAKIKMRLEGASIVKIKGVDKPVMTLRMESDSQKWMFFSDESSNKTPGDQWLLMVDDHFRILKMSTPTSNVEIIRD
ncbi:MAG TPA: hypothetical protein VEW69_05345 [Alphaproteobacteria bacterium]|nr:hypothetical protein [Alphaproteobacteria bacterium]